LLVFAVEMEDLHDARAGLLDRRAVGPRRRSCALIGGRDGRNAGGLQGSEAGVEPGQQEALAIEQRSVRHPLVLFEETVLLERELVKLVAKLLVLLKRFRWRHGGGRAGSGSCVAGEGGGAGVAGCFAAT